MTRRKKTRTLYTLPKPPRPAAERLSNVLQRCLAEGMDDQAIVVFLLNYPGVIDYPLADLDTLLELLRDEFGPEGASKGPGSPPADPETAP